MAALEADYEQARINANRQEALASQQLASELDRRQAHLRADSLARRLQLEQKRLHSTRDSLEAVCVFRVPQSIRLGP